jgi:hypothetical protein
LSRMGYAPRPTTRMRVADVGHRMSPARRLAHGGPGSAMT